MFTLVVWSMKLKWWLYLLQLLRNQTQRKAFTNSSHPLGDLFTIVIKNILQEIYNEFQPVVRILNQREKRQHLGPQVRRLLFTSTLHGSQRSYFPFERLFLPLICIDSSFQPSVQTNWRISGFASAKVRLFCWIFCLIQPNWCFEAKKSLSSIFWTTNRKFFLITCSES